jgi:nicotinamide mononucleotide transporter PnuC
MSPLELVAAALGLANIILIARRTILNYPFGIAMVLLYAVVFAQTRLYSAALLQLFFLGSQIYGSAAGRARGRCPSRGSARAAGCSRWQRASLAPCCWARR